MTADKELKLIPSRNKFIDLANSDADFARWINENNIQYGKLWVDSYNDDDVNAFQDALNRWETEKGNYENNLAKEQAINTNTIQDQANATAADSAGQEASANATANINAGMNAGTAGLLGSANANSNVADTANAMYQGNRATQASTQADYLEKMADSAALDQQVSNLKKGSTLNTIGAAIGGAGAGASMGASISDENMKEDPSSNNKEVDINELLEKVEQFFELKKRLDELKGAK